MSSQRKLLTVITLATFLVGLVLVASGVYLIASGETGSAEISIFDQSLTSTSLGLSTAFLGVVLLVVLVRRVLASVDLAFGGSESSEAPPQVPADTAEKAGTERPSAETDPLSKWPTALLRVADFDPDDLDHERILVQTDHSVIERCRLGDASVVLKRTSRELVDLEALERIAGRDVAARGSFDLKLATPLRVWADADFAYEVYDDYDGVNLDDLVRRNRHSFTGEFIGGFYVALISALTELHELGVLHRDVSPSNLLLLRDGSMALLDASFCCTMEGDKIPVENRDFSAPEVHLGRAVRQSDWYSAACTLYFLAAGVSPRWRPWDEVRSTIRRMHIGAYGNREMRERVFLSVLQEDPAARPAEVWRVTLSPSSAVPDYTLRSVLHLGEQGRYLLMSHDTYSFVDEERIKSVLRSLPETFAEALERKEPLILKPRDGEILQEIDRFLAGASPWTR